MSTKAIRIILLLTLLQVTAQLMASDNLSCNMEVASPSMTDMQHHEHDNMVKDSEAVDMVCCDISSCTMISCIALMLPPLDSSNIFAQKFEPDWLVKTPLYSFQVDSLYKPPILS